MIVKYFKNRPTLPYKWELILLLWLAFFFNQADRQIFNVVLPAIRNELNLTDSDMGLIASILILVYGMLVPVAGYIGDRTNKKYVLMISLIGMEYLYFVYRDVCITYSSDFSSKYCNGWGRSFFILHRPMH